MPSLFHQFKVSRVDFSEDLPTRLNIKKRLEKFLYRTLSNRDNINLSYLICPEVNSDLNLSVVDRGNSLVQNRIREKVAPTVRTTRSFNISSDRFLLTDVFTTETATQQSTPLFYVHTLANFNPATDILLSYTFSDINFQDFNLSELVLDSNKIYNNIVNQYTSLDQSVTYVKYTTRRVSDGITQVYHELIDNSPVYSQASFEDIDDLGNILPGHKNYFIELAPGGSSFLVTLPSSTLYAWQDISDSKIKVLAPTTRTVDSMWGVEVTNGSFLATLPSTPEGSTQVYKYWLADFFAQTFYPSPPIKSQTDIPCLFSGKNLIYLEKGVFLDNASGISLAVFIRDSEGVLKYAYTTNSLLLGTLVEGDIAYTNGILSLDKLNGFVETLDVVLAEDIISASFYSPDQKYLFTDVNFNPIDNRDILRQRVVLYLVPETSTTGALDRTLYYLLVNAIGEITYCSDATLSPSVLGTVYDIPRVDPDYSFIDRYTVESYLFRKSGLTVSEKATFSANPHYLILADISVGENSSPSLVSNFDARVQGGGIKDDLTLEALRAQPEVAWYTDRGVQKPYPSVGAFYVQVPEDLLSVNGGRFTLDQVSTIVEKHMKAGGYPILRSYGIDPVITGYSVGSAELIIEVTTLGTETYGSLPVGTPDPSGPGFLGVYWPSYGAGVVYNTYISSSIDTGFAQDNSSPIVDNPSGNFYEFSGLITSTKYFVKLGAVGSNSIESFSQTIGLVVE